MADMTEIGMQRSTTSEAWQILPRGRNALLTGSIRSIGAEDTITLCNLPRDARQHTDSSILARRTTMEPIKRVIHIGASGRIGQHVLRALIANDFDVTVLARVESHAVFPADVKVVRQDTTSLQLLTEVFRGQDAVVSTVGVRAIAEQYVFIHAAVAAGVRRFIPVSITLSR